MTIQKPFCVIPLALGAIASGNQRANRPCSHLQIHRSQGLVWQSDGIASLWIRGDMGVVQSIDFVSLLGTNAQAGTLARLRLGNSQAEVDGAAAYDSGTQLIISPSIIREDGRYIWHFELPAIQNMRWWRIDISNHVGDFQAMSLVLGKKIQFADFYNQLGFGFGLEDMSSLDFGRYGVSELIDGVKLRTLEMEFGWMSETDRKNKFQPLRDKLGTSGFAYWCFDPESTDQRQDKTYFGRLTKAPSFRPSTFKQDVWQSQWAIQSII